MSMPRPNVAQALAPALAPAVSRAAVGMTAQCHKAFTGKKGLPRHALPASGRPQWPYATATNRSLRVPQIGQFSGGVPNSIFPQTGHR